MKRTILAAVSALMLAAPAAHAADMAVKAPPAPAPVLSWTGFYGGLNGGYGWNTSTGDQTCINPGGVVNGPGCWSPLTGTVRPNGGLFGGQLGYNWQTGPVVFGLETDIQWSGIKGSGSVAEPCCNPGFASSIGVFTASSNLDWFGTVRGRLGVTAGSNALLYATGGLIYGHEVVSDAVTFGGIVYPASASSDRAGGIVGGGIEYAFSPSFSGKIEGLYYDMGSLTDSFTCPAFGTCVLGYTEQTKYSFRGAIIRGGLNAHFNLGGR